MSNADILIKTRRLQKLNRLIQNLLLSIKDIGNLIHKLKSVQSQYTINYNLLTKHLKDDDEIDLDRLRKESATHTKQKLVGDYKQMEVKYLNLSECYKGIDRMYYKEILESVIDEVF